MIRITRLTCTFGEAVRFAAGRPECHYCLVASLDGPSEFASICRALKFLKLEHLMVKPDVPIFDIGNLPDLKVDDEAFFPNMSAIAFLKKIPEIPEPFPAAYVAFREFFETGRSLRFGVTTEGLEEWMKRINAVELVSWSEFVVSCVLNPN